MHTGVYHYSILFSLGFTCVVGRIVTVVAPSPPPLAITTFYLTYTAIPFMHNLATVITLTSFATSITMIPSLLSISPVLTVLHACKAQL